MFLVLRSTESAQTVYGPHFLVRIYVDMGRPFLLWHTPEQAFVWFILFLYLIFYSGSLYTYIVLIYEIIYYQVVNCLRNYLFLKIIGVIILLSISMIIIVRWRSRDIFLEVSPRGFHALHALVGNFFHWYHVKYECPLFFRFENYVSIQVLCLYCTLLMLNCWPLYVMLWRSLSWNTLS